jgi:L-ribulose-5-phosphate 3-epimerase
MDIGIMQGRLVPPEGAHIQAFPLAHWREEFAFASQAGLNAIEWIFDLPDAEVNPLATDAGIAEMHALGREHGVRVESACADYFMARPFVRTTPEVKADRIEKLRWLLGRCQACGITRVVLPCVDASKIADEADAVAVLSVLEQVADDLVRTGVEIHLETSLVPEEFRRFLDRISHPMIKVNYDSGNSSSLGYASKDEFRAYGDRVGSVHIKDRVRGGGTVPLGTGDADFPSLFEALKSIGYRGPWVLQVARGTAGDEVEWAKKNRAFLEGYLKELS